MDFPLLTPVEVRVVGALVEKELTTPEYYPQSLNALTNACNQINNREPVVSYGESDVNRALESLRDKHLAFVTSGGTSRVLKFGHKFAETLHLSPPEVAVLCVLMLRGPQTVGEIRNRSGRLHAFADLAAVQATLADLGARPAPLIVCLPRQPGTKESRYAHLLAGEVAAAPPTDGAPAPAEDEASAPPDRVSALEAEVARLRHEVAELRGELAGFRQQFD
ncbi:MAG: YceH family protein [Candidatus Didemnitutus sp.]|nr:YceH family protein [Candidatus Didemnitutus sp.]